MSSAFECVFPVRYHECDAHGQVRLSNILRYMQEAAFMASASVGYSEPRYRELGYLWLAYETDVEVLQPLRYGDAITVKTWVANFRRVRSLRCYTLWRGNELVAHGYTDWVLIEQTTQRPAKIPEEMQSGYGENQPQDAIPALTPLPPEIAVKPPAGLEGRHHAVVWSEIDGAGHVNNAVYVDVVVDAGWPIPVPCRCHIEYRAQAVLGDQLVVVNWRTPQGVKRSHIRRVEDDALLAVLVWQAI
ncbi:MAG: hypothetical protein OHK0046_21370 [Anaerolineae bacterium]